MNPKSRLSVLLALALILGLGGGVLISQGIADNHQPPVYPKELTSFRDVVKRVMPAIVSVRVTAAKNTEVRGQQRLPVEQFPDLPENMRQFLEEQFNRQGLGDPPPIRPGAFGSGAIIDPKGIVVTNNHVVAGATAVRVTLSDGRHFNSKSIATDPKTDLAIIHLDTKETLPYLELGDSDAMEIGDRVLAFGAPFGLEGSVSSGIVSGKGRSAGMIFYEDYIQTDAAINPGNSGGPLVNLEGKIIGINNSIRSSNGASQGVGMAIPSRIVKEITRQLIKTGAVTRGYLGISFGEVTPELAEQLKLDPNAKGAVIGRVYPNTPASKAGLEEGDVILTLDGKPLTDSKVLQRHVAQAEIGTMLALGILRNGQRQTIRVKTEAQPAEYGLRDQFTGGRRLPNRGRTETPETLRVDKLGLEVTDLTAELKERAGLAKNVAGVVIVNVDRGSLAALAGLRPSQVITSVNQQPVKTPEELEKAVEKASLKEGILLLIKTPIGSEYITLKADE
jgi:serine protease Do